MSARPAPAPGPVARPVSALYHKELRQLGRSRAALLTGGFLALLLMVLAPMSQLISGRAAGGSRGLQIPANLPGLEGLHGPTELFLYVSFPLFFVLSGLLTPSVTANFTVVSERERRTLDLLMALPVSVRAVLFAKLGANITAASLTLLPLFAIDAVLILTLTPAGPDYIAAAFLLVVSSLGASVGVSLLLSLLARDFRTSNNLGGLFVLPTMALTIACVALVPGLARFVVLSAAMLLLGLTAFVIAARWLTFERYLS